jgi:diguanylate cyclase (GGDEF)-like protein/PAS domain S-box-containing protein
MSEGNVRAGGMVASAVDQGIEERLHFQARLLDEIGEAVIATDPQGVITFWNRAAHMVYGWTAEEAIGRSAIDLVLGCMAPEQRREIEAHTRRDERWSGEVTVRRRDGTTFPVLATHTRLHGPDESLMGTVTITADITERKRFEEQLEHRALHDDLTDLPNRSLFTDRLQQAILAATREGKSLAVMVLDLDRFKEINDALGHHSGDQVLQRVSTLLQETLRDSDTVARFGGDEFAILLAGADEAGAVRAAAKVAGVLARPLDFEGQMLYVEASIGIALFPRHGNDPTTLLQRADVAMYQAKRMSSGYAVYRPAQDRHAGERLALIAGLRRAIDHGELVLHYQPKVLIAGGAVEGAEALVRWHHPQHGLIPPARFIGLAEQTGLIRPLTFWVLTEAIAQGAEWRDAGFDLHVCLNLSVRNLHDPELVPTVDRLLRKHGLDPARVVLEITETALAVDPPQARLTVERLAALGVKLSIDDFGTGYSSLAYLQQLPVHRIKIDRSFVLGMMGGGREEGIVRSIIDLGHNLGLHVVAEGVETREMLEHLSTMGCDVAQGYYLSHPLPPGEFVGWLRDRWRQAERAPHVVVVDDQPEVLRAVGDLLEAEGYTVTALSHPGQVDALQADGRPDLFIVDIMLPEVSGIELAERLHQSLHPDIPIVAVSASSFMSRRAQSTGLFRAVLDKPFDVQALLSTVADLVSQRLYA